MSAANYMSIHVFIWIISIKLFIMRNEESTNVILFYFCGKHLYLYIWSGLDWIKPSMTSISNINKQDRSSSVLNKRAWYIPLLHPRQTHWIQYESWSRHLDKPIISLYKMMNYLDEVITWLVEVERDWRLLYNDFLWDHSDSPYRYYYAQQTALTSSYYSPDTQLLDIAFLPALFWS